MAQLPDFLPDNGEELERLIQDHEQSFAPLKEGNEAAIVWADETTRERTEYSIVYLHGFTACRREGYPWHKTIAEKFGCNLYLPRLHSHGLQKEDYFSEFNYIDLIKSALEACRIGQKLGKHLLIMGTSTGASLALYAAGSKYSSVNPAGLLLVSPLIHFYGTLSVFLENKLGRQFAQAVRGRDYKQHHLSGLTTTEEKFWYPYIPIDAAFTLGRFVENELNAELFERVECPAFVGYYNKDKFNHDRVVSPHATKRMFTRLGTRENEKKLINFTEAKTHVICNGLISKVVPELTEKTINFIENSIGIKAVKSI